MKRVIRGRFLVSVIIVVLFIFPTRNVYAEDFQNLSPWQSAYLQILHDARESRDPKAPDGEALTAYMLYDIDKDGIPELILRFGETTAASVCQIYSMSDNNAVFIDRYFYGESSMYSCPDRNGILSVCSRMSHTRAELLSIEADGLNKEFFFEEYVKGIAYTPVSELYPGATPITEFYYPSDYPLLTYDVWSNPVTPAGDVSYPENDPAYFDRLINENAPVLAVPIFKADWFLDSSAPEIMGCEDLLSKLTQVVVDESGEPDYGKFRTFLVDMNQDGKLEYVISHWRPYDEYSDANRFTIILSEQDGTIYAYYDEYSTFTNVDSTGNMYWKDNFGSSGGWVHRIFFQAEYNFELKEPLDVYTGEKERPE